MWRITDDATIVTLTRAVDALPALYIADGHHRSAAASRVAEARGNEPESVRYFLSVLFPAHEMTILGYHRVLQDLNGRSPEALLDALGKDFTVEPSPTPVAPQSAGVFGMVLGGRWYRLTIRPELIPSNDPIGRLPITLLTRHVIEPLFGITDQRKDKRIDFVGGGRGLRELERRVASRRQGGGLRALPDADERPDRGRRRGRDHAAEIDLVRAEAGRRPGQPRARLTARDRMTAPVLIETERLRLRNWRDADLEPFARLNADPRVMEFFPRALDRAASDALAARERARIDEKGYGLYAAEVKDERRLHRLHRARRRDVCRGFRAGGRDRLAAFPRLLGERLRQRGRPRRDRRRVHAARIGVAGVIHGRMERTLAPGHGEDRHGPRCGGRLPASRDLRRTTSSRRTSSIGSTGRHGRPGRVDPRSGHCHTAASPDP